MKTTTHTPQLSAEPWFWSSAGLRPPLTPEIHLFKQRVRASVGTRLPEIVWQMCLRNDEIAVVLADDHIVTAHSGKNGMCSRLRGSYFLP